MLYTLKGKVSKTQPYALDKTLEVEGAAADAKATGEAIEQAKQEATNHANSTENPHKVTKEQVGLSEVDNTSDMDKPVSTLQGEKIEEAKKAGTDAAAMAEEAKTAAGTAQEKADEAHTLAGTAKEKADEAYTLAEEAKANSGGVTVKERTVNVYYVDWNENAQTVQVEGVGGNSIVIVSPTADSYDTYTENGVFCVAQSDGALSFSCDSAPDDLTVNVVIMEVGA